VLHIQNVSKAFPGVQALDGVSFAVQRGEVHAVVGENGAGKSTLMKILAGALAPDSGTVRLSSPNRAVGQGIGLLTEDRKEEGLILDLSVRKNMVLPSLNNRQTLGFIHRDSERRVTSAMVDKLQIKTPSLEKEVFCLNGGNQQKVVIGKWLLSEPRILICDEPTRGVDVSAKMEIYRHLRSLAEQGLGIVMISSELPEILGMCDRVLVMRKGEISAEFPTMEATEEKVMAAALGGRRAEQPRKSPAIRFELRSDMVVYVTLIALFLSGVFSSASFLNAYNLTSIIRHAAALGIVTMGQGMVMIAGGVDLSVSATITLTTILSASLAVGLIMGCINGFAVVKLKVTPFIATLGVMSIGRGVVLLITHGPIGAIGPVFRLVSRGSLGPIPSALVISILVFGLAALVMNRSRYGRYLFSLGGSREVSRLAGIKVPWIEFSSYLVSGLCAALAGLYLTSRMCVGDPSVGPGFELDSIIAVLIGGIPFGGGRGNILGVIAGVLLIAVLGNLLNLWNLQTWYHQIARAVILLTAISIIKQKE